MPASVLETKCLTRYPTTFHLRYLLFNLEELSSEKSKAKWNEDVVMDSLSRIDERHQSSTVFLGVGDADVADSASVGSLN